MSDEFQKGFYQFRIKYTNSDEITVEYPLARHFRSLEDLTKYKLKLIKELQEDKYTNISVTYKSEG
jgi:hypothetical protein